MDGAFNRAGNAMTATVVRQFTRSRIERQLLAQVFELVCAPHWAVEESPLATQGDARTERVGDSEQALQPHVAGRRAV